MNFRNVFFLSVVLQQILMCQSRLPKKVRKMERRVVKSKPQLSKGNTCQSHCEHSFPCGRECCTPDDKVKECYGCFSSTARVSLENGKSVTMSELRVADRVQAVFSKGTLTNSRVGAFLVKQYSSATTYQSFSTSLNTTITLSGNHLIYVRKGDFEKFSPMYADDVSLSDEVLVDGIDGLTTATVLDSFSSVMQGVFVPLTKEGNIMVDGVLASCYASFDHDLAHSIMTPVQWFPEIIGWMFGDENGSAGFVEVTKQLGRWILPLQSVYTKYN